MPKVGGKKYAYTPKGKAQAKSKSKVKFTPISCTFFEYFSPSVRHFVAPSSQCHCHYHTFSKNGNGH